MVQANPREEQKQPGSAKPKKIQDEVFQGPFKFVCSERPASFSYYDRLALDWCQLDNYFVYHKLGRGKYSEVFEGANLNNNQKCVIKILKPVRIEKQYREVKILQTLYGGPNIVKLYDILRDPGTKTPALVFEYIPNIETKVLARRFNNMDIRLYTFMILEALEYSHLHGIMHRDVKPLNIVIDHDNRDLRLIDWGLADFYKPEQEYNVRVASRYYKGPELLVEDKKYNYSLDMWAVGCTLAGFLFKMDTFFKGSDNNDQLVKIINTMGTANLYEYMRRYRINMPKQLTKLVVNTEQVPLESYVNQSNSTRVTQDALDLLYKMLVYDKNGRITPTEAMQHPFFEPIRQLKAQADAESNQ